MARVSVKTAAAWSAALNTGIVVYTVPANQTLYLRYANFSIQNTTANLQSYFGTASNRFLVGNEAAQPNGVQATFPGNGLAVPGGTSISIFSSAASGFWQATIEGDLI